jgi:hypothetical protein
MQTVEGRQGAINQIHEGIELLSRHSGWKHGRAGFCHGGVEAAFREMAKSNQDRSH